LFFKQSINQLLAHRGVGKTMLGLSIAGAMATGGTVMGFKASRPLRVPYVDGELPLSTVERERRSVVCRCREANPIHES
jgi:RecA-family ATPase